MLMEGIVCVASGIQGTSPAAGDRVYLEQIGKVSVDKPSDSGDIVRIVGYVIDPSDNSIFFKPSNDYIELS